MITSTEVLPEVGKAVGRAGVGGLESYRVQSDVCKIRAACQPLGYGHKSPQMWWLETAHI